MTVEQVLHVLWSNSNSTLEKHDEKRLWMLLQQFIVDKGGLHDNAENYDVKRGEKLLGRIRPVGVVKRILNSLGGE